MATASLVLSVIALSACTAGGGTPDASSSGRAAITELTPAKNPDPQAISKAEALLQGNRVAEAARHRYLARCMAEAGEAWNPPSTPPPTIRGLAEPRPLSVAQARETGYTSAQSQESSGGRETGSAAFMGDPEQGAVTAELMGIKGSVGKDGCLGKSYAAVYGSAEDGMRVTGLLHSVLTPVVSLGVVNMDKGIDERWAACMESAGVKSAESPSRLAHQVLQENRAGGKELAVKDARCREEVDYEGAMTSSINAHLTSLFEQYGSDLTVLTEINQRGEQNAASIR